MANSATKHGYDSTYYVGKYPLEVRNVTDIMQDDSCDECGVRYIEAEISIDANIEDVDKVLYEIFEAQHKVHSQYDCTGKNFVWLINTFRDESHDTARYVIIQRWTCDI